MTAPFRPPTDSADLRAALAKFATGVTVITAPGPVGMTVNSFAAVSLDPALVLFSLAKSSGRMPLFRDAPRLAIHVLAHDQHDLCSTFARDAGGFDRARWQEGPERVPLLAGCLARFDCRPHACHDGGDHVILISQVLTLTTAPGAPLIFYDRAFGGFADPPDQ